MYNQPIRSDDENALEKLKEKAEKLKADQEEMVKANAHFRKNGTMKGFKDISDEKAETLDEKIYKTHEKKPYASWQLQNNNQNLRTTEQRIKSLERENSPEQAERTYDTSEYGFEVVENKEAMRLQLFFDGKPKEEIRNILKSNGFKWAPSNECWQRLLNNNARYSLQYIMRQMDKELKSGSAM